jgi:hypothetical protein
MDVITHLPIMDVIMRYHGILRNDLQILYRTTRRLLQTTNTLPESLNNDVLEYLMLILITASELILYIETRFNIIQLEQSHIEDIEIMLYDVNTMIDVIYEYYTRYQVIIC